MPVGEGVGDGELSADVARAGFGEGMGATGCGVGIGGGVLVDRNDCAVGVFPTGRGGGAAGDLAGAEGLLNRFERSPGRADIPLFKSSLSGSF